MLRKTCPWCGQEVDTESKDIIKTVNGSRWKGINFTTTMYAHRSCYDKEVIPKIKKSISEGKYEC